MYCCKVEKSYLIRFDNFVAITATSAVAPVNINTVTISRIIYIIVFGGSSGGSIIIVVSKNIVFQTF